MGGIATQCNIALVFITPKELLVANGATLV